MNMIKGMFVSILPVLGLAMAIYQGYMIYESGWTWTRAGALLGAMTIALVFASIFLVARARTGANLIGYSLLVGLGIIIALVGVFVYGEPSTALWSSTLMGISWWFYVRWYSIFEQREKSTLAVGKKLPAFELIDEQGQSKTIEDLTSAPRIWMFYRGNWCPLCMAQIKEVSGLYQEIEKRGAKVALISSQPHRYIKGLAKKHKVNFDFLRDQDNEAAKALGIFAKNGTPTAMVALGYELDTAMPTIFITDKGGNIVYSDLTDNYRVRPEPQEFLKVLDKVA